MSKELPLTLEALRIMDAIEKRGSFAAAAKELSRVPSAISYSMQKLEEDLDVMIFDRSGRKTRLTKPGIILLERGRQLLSAAEQLIFDAKELAQGWESRFSIVCSGLVDIQLFFPLVATLQQKCHTELTLSSEMLNGAWEKLILGEADIVVAPELEDQELSEFSVQKVSVLDLVYVAAPNHPIHKEPMPLSIETRMKYHSVVIPDSSKNSRPLSVNILDKQPTFIVSTMTDRYKAISAGLGIGTMPYYMVRDDINTGKLKMIGGKNDTMRINLMLAWRRDSMGEVKSWMLRELPKFIRELPLTF
ncbi:LysR family transcriptional regulator [Thorsellia kenyensis]|uniref:LysR family transcriptional regulator n=1 Tax=Thorsellia kenyensis TaxID=1549888 RepID=A0ABV6CAQ9_9GAMM